MSKRPSFIVNWKDHLGADDGHYPDSDELLSYGCDYSGLTGLGRLGIWMDVMEPGRRSSWPHAHSKDEEFILVVEGTPEVWVDGTAHKLGSGDVVGFPAGTGIAHCFINNSDALARLLVIGDKGGKDDKIHYPLHPARNDQVKERGSYWADVPARELGGHDGKPDALRGSKSDVGAVVERPPFIFRWDKYVGVDENHYPDSDELLCYGAEFTTPLGFAHLGVGIDILKPGRRSGWPHAHEAEEEFVLILQGTPDLWIDGELHSLGPGDAAGFPAGTGIAHSILNNTADEAHFLVAGERNLSLTGLHYPMHPARNASIGDRHWKAADGRARGPHDGKPDALRKGEA